MIITRTACLAFVLCTFLINTAQAERVDPPLQSRMMEWVNAGTFKFPVDQSPKWLHSKDWTGSSKVPTTFIAETPENYYPPATFNAQHFSEQQVPEGERDSKYFFEGMIESIAKNYGFTGQHLKDIEYTKKGSLKGYMVSFPGNISGHAQDIILFVAAAPDNSVFSLVAFTDPDKAPHLQTTFNRIAINIEFIEKELKDY